jgi:hypothetical protein
MLYLEPSNHRVIVSLFDGTFIGPIAPIGLIPTYGADFANLLILFRGPVLFDLAFFYQFADFLKVVVGQSQLVIVIGAVFDHGKVLMVEEGDDFHLGYIVEEVEVGDVADCLLFEVEDVDFA